MGRAASMKSKKREKPESREKVRNFLQMAAGSGDGFLKILYIHEKRMSIDAQKSAHGGQTKIPPPGIGKTCAKLSKTAIDNPWQKG
jgi:hypothetical protein